MWHISICNRFLYKTKATSTKLSSRSNSQTRVKNKVNLSININKLASLFPDLHRVFQPFRSAKEIQRVEFKEFLQKFKRIIRKFLYSCVHKRSDAYSTFLSKPQLLSMTWRTFKMLLPAWQSGSKQNLIGGFQKGTTCSCISKDTKVEGYQIFFIFQKLLFSLYVSYCL